MAADEHQTLASPAQAALGIALGFALALMVTLLLPFDSYIAWQQARGTDLFHARWLYERMVYDPSRIDVALIGSSRFESGLSAPLVSAKLEQELGHPVQVANLSLVMPGRDFAYESVKLLLAHHPEVELIVLTDDGDVVDSHAYFPQVASVADVLRAPVFVNTKYASNLLQIPYRNLSNVAQQLAPLAFGVETRFNPGDYAGTGLDRTMGYQTPDGARKNGALRGDPAALIRMSAAAVARQRSGLAKLGMLDDRYRLAVDRTYVARIAALAGRCGVRVAFMRLPLVGPIQSPGSADSYRRFGPEIDLSAVASHTDFYWSAAHFNRQGAVAVSELAGAQLAPWVRAGRSGPPSDCIMR